MVREESGSRRKRKIRERKVTKGSGVGQVRVYGEMRGRNSKSRITTTSKSWKRITENTKEVGQRMLRACGGGGGREGLGRMGQENEEDTGEKLDERKLGTKDVYETRS